MSLDRMPLFCWAMLATSFSVVFALPAAHAANTCPARAGARSASLLRPGGGGDPLLWQHLFWIFGHPDVYIIFLPAVGIVSSIIPVFSRRPMVGYTLVGAGDDGHRARRLRRLGAPHVRHRAAALALAFFSAASMVIAVPSGVQMFAWLATMLCAAGPC